MRNWFTMTSSPGALTRRALEFLSTKTIPTCLHKLRVFVVQGWDTPTHSNTNHSVETSKCRDHETIKLFESPKRVVSYPKHSHRLFWHQESMLVISTACLMESWKVGSLTRVWHRSDSNLVQKFTSRSAYLKLEVLWESRGSGMSTLASEDPLFKTPLRAPVGTTPTGVRARSPNDTSFQKAELLDPSLTMTFCVWRDFQKSWLSNQANHHKLESLLYETSCILLPLIRLFARGMQESWLKNSLAAKS